MNEIGLIEAADLRAALEKKRPVFILDVRPAPEAAEWWIPGRTHVDAYTALWAGDRDALAGVKIPDGVEVVTVCGAGNTSVLAAQALAQRGIKARSLTGGMKAWGSAAWNTGSVSLPRSGATIVQVRRTGKGCLSYIVGSGNEAAVIDASLSPETYRALAEAHGWKIRAVLETHLHADHLWRGPDLAREVDAKLYLPPHEPTVFQFAPMRAGTELQIGDVKLRVIETPGHTLTSTTIQVGDEALITGDTLFLDSVGRPDLQGTADDARRQATMLHASLRVLAALDPEMLVFPAHTSKPVPFDEVALTSRLGEIRSRVPQIDLTSDGFVEQLLKRLPPAPANHRKILRLNQSGLGAYADGADLEAGGNRCAAF